MWNLCVFRYGLTFRLVSIKKHGRVIPVFILNIRNEVVNNFERMMDENRTNNKNGDYYDDDRMSNINNDNNDNNNNRFSIQRNTSDSKRAT